MEDTFVLDKEAKGGITGSRISNDLDDEQQNDNFRVSERELSESECEAIVFSSTSTSKNPTSWARKEGRSREWTSTSTSRGKVRQFLMLFK